MSYMDKYNKLKGFEKLALHAKESHEGGYGDYYFETGRYKPWSLQTLKAAERRGLVESYTNPCAGVYLVKMTEKGLELGKEVSQKLKG